MCTNPDLPWLSKDGTIGDYNYESLIKRIRGLKDKISHSDAIILTGGETTLQPRFLDVLKFARQTFPENEIRILTNGRKFFYKDFTQSILETDNLNIAVSLYGPTAKIHDGITRTKNSFEQTIKGLENILIHRKKNQVVEIRTVISKLSYKYLDQILNLINVRFSSVDRVILIFMEMEGQAEKNLKSVGLSYSEISPYFKKIYPQFALLKELRLYHFPLCTLESKFWPFVWRTLPKEEVTFISACKKCQYKKYCLGIHRDYPDKTKEFKPVKKDLIIKETKDFYHPIIGIKER